MAASRVLIIERSPLLRQALRELTDGQEHLTVVGALGSCEAVLAATRELRPAIVVLDAAAMDGRVLSVTAVLSRRAPVAATVLLASDPTGREIYDGFVAGAAAYVSREASQDELVDALEQVRAGRPALSPAFALRLAEYLRLEAGRRTQALTRREQEALQLLSQGMTVRTIAARLEVAESTVKSHLGNLYRKLGVRNAAAAVAVAIESGLL